MIAVLEREAERVALSKLRLEQGLKIVAAIRERVVLTCSDFLLLEQEADCSLDDVWIDPFDEYERIWAETDLEAAA